MPVLLTIKKSSIFKQIHTKGIAVVNNGFVLKFLPSSKDSSIFSTEDPEFGFAVSKKLGTAVKRNLIKRRLKNAIKEELTNFSAKGFYVFIAKNKLGTMRYSCVRDNIKNSLKSLSYLLNNESNK